MTASIDIDGLDVRYTVDRGQRGCRDSLGVPEEPDYGPEIHVESVRLAGADVEYDAQAIKAAIIRAMGAV
jgi:hypothetical protein